MRRGRRILFFGALLGGVILAGNFVSLRAVPATQPDVEQPGMLGGSDLPDMAPNALGIAPDDGKNHRNRPMQRAGQPLTAKETADALAFMKEKSPERYNAIESLPDGERKTNIENRAAAAYLRLKSLRTSDPDLYPIVEKRMELEDQVFGKVSQYRKATPQTRPAIRAELEALVGKMVENGLEERGKRLAKLQQTLADEQKKLEADSANRTAVVEDRMKAILNSDSGGLIPAGNFGNGPSPGTGRVRNRP